MNEWRSKDSLLHDLPIKKSYMTVFLVVREKRHMIFLAHLPIVDNIIFCICFLALQVLQEGFGSYQQTDVQHDQQVQQVCPFNIRPEGSAEKHNLHECKERQ